MTWFRYCFVSQWTSYTWQRPLKKNHVRSRTIAFFIFTFFSHFVEKWCWVTGKILNFQIGMENDYSLLYKYAVVWTKSINIGENVAAKARQMNLYTVFEQSQITVCLFFISPKAWVKSNIFSSNEQANYFVLLLNSISSFRLKENKRMKVRNKGSDMWRLVTATKSYGKSP